MSFPSPNQKQNKDKLSMGAKQLTNYEREREANRQKDKKNARLQKTKILIF